MSKDVRSRKGFDETIESVSDIITPLVPLMDERYIGYIDFLGFSKIVEVQPMDRLEWIYSELYNYSLQQISEEKRFVFRGNPMSSSDLSKIKLNMLFVSDSIVLWTNDTSIESFHTILVVLLNFLEKGFLYKYPVRGALVKGYLGVNNIKEKTEYYVGGQFVYGPGFLKAVKIEESQNWSGCVIDRECLEYYNELVSAGNIENAGIDYLLDLKAMVKDDVPFKKGNEECYVINWPISISLNEKMLLDAFSEWGKSTEDPRAKLIIDHSLDFFRKHSENTYP